MNADQIDAYLARIGARRPAAPDAASLRELQEHHLSTVPFENLSIHLDERITLTEDALFDKIVMRRRGGFCYELNGAFAALLRGLGFDVTLLSAKVFGDGGKRALRSTTSYCGSTWRSHGWPTSDSAGTPGTRCG